MFYSAEVTWMRRPSSNLWMASWWRWSCSGKGAVISSLQFCEQHRDEGHPAQVRVQSSLLYGSVAVNIMQNMCVDVMCGGCQWMMWFGRFNHACFSWCVWCLLILGTMRFLVCDVMCLVCMCNVLSVLCVPVCMMCMPICVMRMSVYMCDVFACLWCVCL